MCKKFVFCSTVMIFLITFYVAQGIFAQDPDLELENAIEQKPPVEPIPEVKSPPEPVPPISPESGVTPKSPAAPQISPTEASGKTEAQPKEQELISLNFQNTDIDLVLKFFSEITGLTFIRADNVRGQVTVISSKRVPIDEALDILQSILEIKGFTMVRSENVMKVVTQAEAAQKSIEIKIGGPGELKGGDKVVTQMIPLKYVLASDVRNDLQPLISRNGTIMASERTNTLILTDVASNIKKIIKILEQLDVQIYQDKVKIDIIPLQFAEETTLAKKLMDILTNTKPRLVGNLEIIPDQRLHALIIITNEANVSVVHELATRLDKESPKVGDNTRVFFLQNSKASEMAKTLNELLAKPNSGPGGGAIIEGNINIVTEDRTNAMIITTAPQNYPAINKIIEQLDVRTPQVLIEALIAEVSLTTETKLGLEWTYTQGWGEKHPEVTGTLSQNFGVGSFMTGGLRYSVLKGDATSPDLTALLQLLATDQKVNILSTPHVLASNNQQASIRIGEEIPILKEAHFVKSTASDEGEYVKTYDYKTVAIELIVTPRINTQKDVAMEVQQTIKKVLGYNSELNAPILATREAKTNVVVKNGQTMVIGGLMKDDDTKAASKIPLLGDIPVLGWLFKKEGLTKEKTELMVFITPHVVLTPEEGEKLTKEQESRVSMKTTPYKKSAKEHYQLGLEYYKKGQYTEAINEWQQTIEASPRSKIAIKSARLINKTKLKQGKNEVNSVRPSGEVK